MSPSCPTKVTRTALSVTDIDQHISKTLSTRSRHVFGHRAVPLISSTIASTSKSGIRLQLASSSHSRCRSAMLASHCQTLRARTSRTRSPRRWLRGALGEAERLDCCHCLLSAPLGIALWNTQRVRSRPCHRGPAHRFRHSDPETFLIRKSMKEGN